MLETTNKQRKYKNKFAEIRSKAPKYDFYHLDKIQKMKR